MIWLFYILHLNQKRGSISKFYLHYQLYNKNNVYDKG